MAIEINKEAIFVDGVSTVAIADGLIAAGMQNTEVMNLIGHMLVGYVGGKGKPAFRFTTEVEATDERCRATFERSFEHTDWVDGVSRVQAGLTPEELGFNARFHALEADLDGVSEQFSALSGCVRALRADLVGVVGELEAKITDMDRQIQDLKSGSSTGNTATIRPGAWEYLGSANIGEQSVIVSRLGDEIMMSEVQKEMITGGKVFKGGSATVVAGTEPFPVDPGRLGSFVIDTDGREVVMPADSLVINADRLATSSGRPLAVEDLNRFTSIVEERLGGVAGERTVGSVRANGDALVVALTDGVSESESLTDAGLVNLVTERVLAGASASERDSLRDSVLRADVADRSGGALMSSGVVGLASVSETDADVLGAAGFGRIGTLAGATVKDVINAVEASGGQLDESRVRAAVTGARVARALRSR
ncbi:MULTISPECIES: hypothetical protein [unclassified Salinibacterium]|uniref:hypothetical protein n=1 Tax=unclassified Salinibacterium TaxID=2632331 RepID=UPI0018CE1233|nr:MULTISPECIES: hypothetical protein [unclassified Salinibacterium]MBH0053134.1 hypothetical protein [Salinibacterium sp. SWN139]MBH0082400.1 hypothetical protein [Salinibacterium sp. SWN167]